MIRKMLKDFGLNPDEGRIINGHTPVKEIDGEDPIKAMVKVSHRWRFLSINNCNWIHTFI